MRARLARSRRSDSAVGLQLEDAPLVARDREGHTCCLTKRDDQVILFDRLRVRWPACVQDAGQHGAGQPNDLLSVEREATVHLRCSDAAKGAKDLRRAHHAALTAKKAEMMQSHGERIGWVEAELQTLTARVEAHERSARSDLRQAGMIREEAALEERRERQILADEVRRLRRDVDFLQNMQEGMGSFAETTRSMIGPAYLWLMALSAIAAVEAVAIVALWWSR